MSGGNKKKKHTVDKDKYTSIVDGLKKLYVDKIKPVEINYKFDQFHSPTLNDADIEAKPMVLLLGQYSTGKTTFIRYLLRKDFPGMNIGPEPTTDRFMAVMAGTDERSIPGNAVAVQADKPFMGLGKFGTAFLSKFQCSQVVGSEILDDIIIVDTPGVLSGEKQRIGRSYDFTSVIEWFAERADMILLLFDAHKLDISDELKSAIEVLKGQDDKIRVVLNKADMVSAQQLLRVYGALMWSLGKVIKSPEVVRVYLGSFWDQPLKNEETRVLLTAEMEDLLKDLRSLPRNAAVRKINEIVKRARLAKTHAHIVSHLKAQMPQFFYKESKQNDLIDNLEAEFAKISQLKQIPRGDFPEVEKFKSLLKGYKISEFPKLNNKMIDNMDDVLAVDIPDLMKQFPGGIDDTAKVVSSALSNPFTDTFNAFATEWHLFSRVDKSKYAMQFEELGPVDGKLSGAIVRDELLGSKLPNDVLARVWQLSDMDKDGKLDLDEFCIAKHLVTCIMTGIEVPPVLPPTLIPPSKRV